MRGAYADTSTRPFSLRHAQGLIQLDQEINALFNEKSLQAVMHLINDDREIVGAGESLFIQGAVWCAPLGSISREGL
jgi:hypothetical protein